MAIQHRILPDSELHEPKGAAGAVSGTTYISDGAGSGIWKKIPATSLQGISSADTPDRRVVTDGSGGFKLVDGNVYGQIYYRTGASTPVNHNIVSYITGPMSNMNRNGQRLRAMVSGVYQVRFLGTAFENAIGEGISYSASLTSTGSNVIGSECRDSSAVMMDGIAVLLAGGEIWVNVTSGNLFTRDGSLTMTYLGA